MSYYPDLCLASDKTLSLFFKDPLILTKGRALLFPKPASYSTMFLTWCCSWHWYLPFPGASAKAGFIQSLVHAGLSAWTEPGDFSVPNECWRVRGQDAEGPQQFLLVEGVSACGRAVGAWGSLRTLPVQTSLWFYEFNSSFPCMSYTWLGVKGLILGTQTSLGIKSSAVLLAGGVEQLLPGSSQQQSYQRAGEMFPQMS